MIKKLGGILPLVLVMCLLTSLAALAAPGIPVIYRNANYAAAAIGGLRRLKAGVLAAAGQLKPVIVEALLASSGLRTGGGA
jgi:hypothetical protein